MLKCSICLNDPKVIQDTYIERVVLCCEWSGRRKRRNKRKDSTSLHSRLCPQLHPLNICAPIICQAKKEIQDLLRLFCKRR